MIGAIKNCHIVPEVEGPILAVMIPLGSGANVESVEYIRISDLGIPKSIKSTWTIYVKGYRIRRE